MPSPSTTVYGEPATTTDAGRSTTTKGATVPPTTTPPSTATPTTAAKPSVVSVTISAYMFSPAHPTAKAGEVDFQVKNNDPFEHTFTVTGTTVDIALAASGSGSAKAALAAGDYEFHCKIHSSMTGTLTVFR